MKSIIKDELKRLPVTIAIFLCLYAVTTYATEYLFSASEVNYDNSTSQMAANNVQDAVDELYSCATDYVALNNRMDALEDGLNNIDFSEIENQVSALSNKIYPVGSIYISVTDSTASAVHDRLGGTWVAFGQGRTLVGMGSNGTDSYTTVESYNGSTTATLVEGNLPAHTHSIPALSGTAASSGAHTHSVSGSTSSAGAHTHPFRDFWHISSDSGSLQVASVRDISWSLDSGSTQSAGAHTHTISGTAASNGAHTHSVTTVANTSGSTGSGTAFSVQDPYITVYMWKRTA